MAVPGQNSPEEKQADHLGREYWMHKLRYGTVSPAHIKKGKLYGYPSLTAKDSEIDKLVSMTMDAKPKNQAKKWAEARAQSES